MVLKTVGVLAVLALTWVAYNGISQFAKEGVDTPSLLGMAIWVTASIAAIVVLRVTFPKSN